MPGSVERTTYFTLSAEPSPLGLKTGIAAASPSTARSGAAVSTVTVPEASSGPLPQASVAVRRQVASPSGTEPAAGAQVIAAVSPVPECEASVAPPPSTKRSVQEVTSDWRTLTVIASPEPSPLGEKVPSPSVTSQTRGAAESRGTSVAPDIQPWPMPSACIR